MLSKYVVKLFAILVYAIAEWLLPAQHYSLVAHCDRIVQESLLWLLCCLRALRDGIVQFCNYPGHGVTMHMGYRYSGT